MITIPMKIKGAYDRNTLLSINHTTARRTQNTTTIAASGTRQQTPQTAQPPSSSPTTIRQQTTAAARQTPAQTNAAQITPQRIPQLKKPVQKGQKIAIGTPANLQTLQACFGWNTTNPQCDVDVSAFLLGSDGKVLGDSWFVFYGQTASPDQSTVFEICRADDRETITIDLQKLNQAVQKIVFVLTINEAFEKRLHFGMMKDAYIRILNPRDKTEYVSFQMTDYYTNVISMMIGELYQHNGTWKFSAVGNGIAKDLAGLCGFYGVQVID